MPGSGCAGVGQVFCPSLVTVSLLFLVALVGAASIPMIGGGSIASFCALEPTQANSGQFGPHQYKMVW
jgi:hypothetical protein